MAARLHATLYRLLNSYLFPDLHLEWLPAACCQGYRLLRRDRYQAIISSSEPRIGHLLGYLLSRRSGARWIADYGDPWVYPIPLHR